MWSIFDKTDHFVITTNPIVKKDGSVVMGRGIALQAKQRFPKLPYDFGECLSWHPTKTCGYIGTYDDTHIWFFMVKHHWAQKADFGVISDSTEQLRILANFADERRFDLNFPGIGNGGLDREDVLSIIQELPDNVHVWEYE